MSEAPRSAYAARQFPLTIEHTAFWAERDKTAIGKEFESENSKEKAQVKALNYSAESAEDRRGLDASRKDEWKSGNDYKLNVLTGKTGLF